MLTKKFETKEKFEYWCNHLMVYQILKGEKYIPSNSFPMVLKYDIDQEYLTITFIEANPI